MLKTADKLIIITEKIIVSKLIKYLEQLEVHTYSLYHDLSEHGHQGTRSISGGLSQFGETIRLEIIIEDEEKAKEVAENIYQNYFVSRYDGVVYLEKIRIVTP